MNKFFKVTVVLGICTMSSIAWAGDDDAVGVGGGAVGVDGVRLEVKRNPGRARQMAPVYEKAGGTKISLDVKDRSAKDVLNMIAESSGIAIDTSVVPFDKIMPLTLAVKDVTVLAALEMVMKITGLTLTVPDDGKSFRVIDKDQ